jgi:plasmid stabilization system protein ParE
VECLYRFIAKKNPAAASRVAGTILEGAEFLLTAPKAGRPMLDETRRREWFVPFGSSSYVLRYRIDNDHTVVIIRVWHSKEIRN